MHLMPQRLSDTNIFLSRIEMLVWSKAPSTHYLTPSLLLGQREQLYICITRSVIQDWKSCLFLGWKQLIMRAFQGQFITHTIITLVQLGLFFPSFFTNELSLTKHTSTKHNTQINNLTRRYDETIAKTISYRNTLVKSELITYI